MTPEEQAAQRPFDVLRSLRTTGIVPHDAVTKMDPSTGYSFRDADGNTWTHAQVTKAEIYEQNLDISPYTGERAIETTPYGQRYYFQNDGGKMCLTRLNNGPYIKTPARLVIQERFHNAVDTWTAMSQEERDVYNHDIEAIRRQIPGRNLFISRFMKGKI